MSNKRGRRNRGIAAQGRRGLGNRDGNRNRRGASAPLDPRAMGSVMTNGASDPRPINTTIKVQHRLQVIFTPTAAAPTLTVTPALLAAQLSGGSTGWPDMRIMKIDAWGNTADGVFVILNSPESDLSEFNDFGTLGSHRAVVHVLPNFAMRSTWYPSGSTSSIFTFGSILGVATSVSSDTTPFVLNVTVELQSPVFASPQFLGLERVVRPVVSRPLAGGGTPITDRSVAINDLDSL